LEEQFAQYKKKMKMRKSKYSGTQDNRELMKLRSKIRPSKSSLRNMNFLKKKPDQSMQKVFDMS